MELFEAKIGPWNPRVLDDQRECFASPSHELYLDSSVLYVQSEQFLNCWQDTLQTLQFRGLKRPSAKQRNQHSLQFSSITTTVNK